MGGAPGPCGPGMLSFESCGGGMGHRKRGSEAPSLTSSFSRAFHLQPFSRAIQTED